MQQLTLDDFSMGSQNDGFSNFLGSKRAAKRFKPAVRPKPVQLIEVISETETTPTEPKPAIKRPRRGLFGGIRGLFKRKKLQRPVEENRLIVATAKQVWDKNTENWSSALLRAEDLLVEQGDISPAAYVSYDGDGNEIGLEFAEFRGGKANPCACFGSSWSGTRGKPVGSLEGGGVICENNAGYVYGCSGAGQLVKF